MDKQEIRLENFLKVLEDRKFISVNEMSVLLGVSNMTVRRDFTKLNSQQLVIMKNGILMLNDEQDVRPIKKTYDLGKETHIRNSVKADIGKFAASLIAPDDNVIIDTGSTTVNIVPNISGDIRINMLSYNLNILLQAQQNPNINIAFAGGYYHSNTQMFESVDGINFINSFRANKVFVSAAGIHRTLGITCVNSYEVPTKKAILNSADEHILVADSSKFDDVHSSYFCDLPQIDTIITDKGISKEWLNLLADMEITVYTV